ncbi:MAG: glycoside hydrolase family 127 protein [Sedimentisphaerales bacterium]|nr:glycoside hydrolase family 127 protein [Sedimentisphaerales bacterium]
MSFLKTFLQISMFCVFIVVSLMFWPLVAHYSIPRDCVNIELTAQNHLQSSYSTNMLTSLISTVYLCSTSETKAVEAKAPRIENPVAPTAVSSIGGFIRTRLDANRNGYLHTFDIDTHVKMFEEKTHRDWWWPGEQAGKWLESAVLTAEQSRDKKLRGETERIFFRLVASQEPSGYLGITDPAIRTDKLPLRGMDAYELYFMLHALLTTHELWNDDASLKTATRLGDYFVDKIGPGKAEFWPKPKNETIAGHAGHASLEGTLLTDPMLRLYLATGDRKYLEWSQWVIGNIDKWSGYNTFSKLDSVADGNLGVHQLLSGRGIHAHTLHMNLLGLLRLYQATGDESLLRKVQGAWRDIANRQAYITGGVSSNEGYWAGNQPPLVPQAVETCSTMSWMLVSQYLLELTADNVYADMIERSLWNHLLAAQTVDGEAFRYFTPLNGNKPAGYFPKISPNCCTASGPRIVSMIPLLIYGVGNEAVFVNQFVDSTVEIKLDSGNIVSLKQETNYPSDGTIVIKVHPKKPSSFTLYVRLPAWCQNPSLNVNGQAVGDSGPGTYAKLDRKWKDGDSVTLSLPMRPKWVKRLNNDEEVWALTHGPLVYAIDTIWWDKSLSEALGDVPNDLSDVVKLAIYESGPDASLKLIDAPAGTLGPAYSVVITLTNNRREMVSILPFANVGCWYADAANKPDRKENCYAYAIWLSRAADYIRD